MKINRKNNKCIVKVDDTANIIDSDHCSDLILNSLLACKNTADLTKNEITTELKRIIGTIRSMAPQDEFEVILMAQMLIVMDHTVESFRLAKVPANKKVLGSFKILQEEGRKMMRLYVLQLKALDDHRGKMLA